MSHECDCGAVYSHVDQLHACANNGHGEPGASSLARERAKVDLLAQALRGFLRTFDTAHDESSLRNAIQTNLREAIAALTAAKVSA